MVKFKNSLKIKTSKFQKIQNSTFCEDNLEENSKKSLKGFKSDLREE